MSNFEFTFKNHADYFSERMKGYIEEYKCVRVEIISAEGWNMDFPLHSEEEYNNYLNNYLKEGDRIIKTYPSTTFYESKYNY
jgi:hypothetical protein